MPREDYSMEFRSMTGTFDVLHDFAVECGLGERKVIGRMGEDIDIPVLLDDVTAIVLYLDTSHRGGYGDQRVVVIRTVGEHMRCRLPGIGDSNLIDIGYPEDNQIWKYDYEDRVWRRDRISESRLFQAGAGLVVDLSVLGRPGKMNEVSADVVFADCTTAKTPGFVIQSIFLGANSSSEE